MTEKTVEIGIVHIPNEWDPKAINEPEPGAKACQIPCHPIFKKLTEEEIKDHLSL